MTVITSKKTMGNFVAPSSSIFFFQKSSCKFDTSNLSRSTELKTYVKKTFVMGNVLPRFHSYFFLQKQTRLVKQLFCKLSRREVYVQDFLFLCWTFDFLLCGGIVASCEGGRCKKYRRAVQWSASLNCSLSQNCHKTFAFSPLIPKQMIADPQTWEEQLVQITSSEWKFSVYIFRPGKQTLQNSYFRKKPYDVVDYIKKCEK